MKNTLKSLFILILCLPALLFVGCGEKDSDLPSIKVTSYYEQDVTANVYGESTARTLSLTDMTASELASSTPAAYTQIQLKGKQNWLYKMYIDCVTFYVYTNESRDTEMIVNITFSNLADENDRNNPSKFESETSFVPQANNAVLCKIKVGKMVPSATDGDCYLKFDISNSTNTTIMDANGNVTTFKWAIYGLKIYGESRTYS